MELKGTCAITIRLFSCSKCLARDITARKRSSPRRKQEATEIYRATVPQRRKVKRKLQSVGGKSQGIGSCLRKLRDEIIYHEIIVDGGRKLQHTMSGDLQQIMLNYEGQRVLARVKGPTELEAVGKMFAVFILSLREEGFYVHEGGLQNMMVKDVDVFRTLESDNPT
jgi:hypothetical protein